MKELIKNVLQALNMSSGDEDITRILEAADLPDDTGNSEQITRALSDHLGISEAAIRAILSDTEQVEISSDAEETMRTLEELTKARVGNPYITTTNQIRRYDEQNRTVTVINTETEDRHGTIIDPQGGSLDNYRKNPVFLINHSYSLPAGNNAKVRMQNGQIITEVSDSDWNDDKETEKGREILFWKSLVKQGKVKMASVGIMPLEIERQTREDPQTGEDREYTVISRWELLEWSFVPVGSNPEALVMQRNLSLSGQDPSELLQRIQGLEEAVQQVNELKRAMQDLYNSMSPEQRKNIETRSIQALGITEATDELPDENSDEEEDSGSRAVPYVKPRKGANKQTRYIPRPDQVKPLSADEIAERVSETIKRKQGKR